MARNVGSIEVTVDANTGKLNAKMHVAGTKGGKSYASAFEKEMGDISGRELQARLKLIRAKAEAALRDFKLDVGIDQKAFQRGLQGIAGQLRAAEQEMRIAAEVDPELDVDDLLDELRTARLLVNDVPFDLEPHMQEGELLALHEMTEQLFGDIEAIIEPRVDETALAGAMAEMEAASAAAGRKSGDSFGGGFNRGMSARMKAIAAGIVVLMEPAAVAIQGALGGAAAVASSAFYGLAGGIGAAGGALAGLGAAGTAAIVGLEGFGGAIGAINEEWDEAIAGGREFNINADGIAEALAKLAPSARDAALAFAEIRGAFADVRIDTQQRLFAGLDDTIRQLGATALPSIGKALGAAADSLNDFFKDLGDVAGDVDFEGIFKELQPAVDSLLDAGVDLARAFEPFLKAAAPAAEEFANWIERGADSLARLTEHGEESGELSRFLSEGVESLKQWADLTGAVGDALGTFFAAGKATGDSFIESLTHMVDRWDAWMESLEGQAALEDFFDTASTLIKSLEPLLEGVQDFFKNLVTKGAVDRFGDLAQNLGDVLGPLGQIFELVGRANALGTTVDLLARIGEALQPAMPVLQDLADLIGTTLAQALDELAPLLPPLIELFVSLAEESLTAAVEVLPALVELFGAVVDAIVPLLPALTPLLDNLTLLWTGMGIGLPLVEALTAFLVALTPAIEALESPLLVATEALDLLLVPLRLVSEVLGTIAPAFEKAGNWVKDKFTPDIEAITDLTPEATARLREMGNAAGETNQFEAGRDAMRAVVDEAQRLGQQDRAVQVATDLNDELQRMPTPAEEAADALARMTEEAEDAAEASDTLKDSWDLLFGRGADLQEAVDETTEALHAINLELMGGTESLELRKQADEAAANATELFGKADRQAADGHKEKAKATREAARAERDRAADLLAEADALAAERAELIKNDEALSNNTEIGRENRDMVREGVDAVIAETVARVAADKPMHKTRQRYEELRESMIDQVVALGKTREEAERYVAKLGLVPAEKLTKVNLLGGPEAQEQIDNLAFAQDNIERLLEIVVPRPKQELAEGGLQDLQDQMGEIDRVLAIETELPGRQFTKAQLDELQTKRDKLDRRIRMEITADDKASQVLEGSSTAVDHLAQGAIIPLDVEDKTAGELRRGVDAVDHIAQGAVVPISVEDNTEGKLVITSTAVDHIAQGAVVPVSAVDNTQNLLWASEDAVVRIGEGAVAPIGALDNTDGLISSSVAAIDHIDEGAVGKIDAEDNTKGLFVRAVEALEAIALGAMASVTVDDQASFPLGNIQAGLDALEDKTVTVSVNTVQYTDYARTAQSGISPSSHSVLAGEAGPELFRRGTLRGLLTGPTMMPPRTEITSAALTAALLRGQGKGSQKVVNLNMNVQPNAADPEAVATSVINRAAALVG